jgi:hypothetical protein
MNTVPPKKLRLKSLLVTGFLICASGIVSAQTSEVTSAPFGQTSDGKPIELYTLSNQHGMKVGIATYGATIVNLIVPDRSGKALRRLPGDPTLPGFAESFEFPEHGSPTRRNLQNRNNLSLLDSLTAASMDPRFSK